MSGETIDVMSSDVTHHWLSEVVVISAVIVTPAITALKDNRTQERIRGSLVSKVIEMRLGTQDISSAHQGLLYRLHGSFPPPTQGGLVLLPRHSSSVGKFSGFAPIGMEAGNDRSETRG